MSSSRVHTSLTGMPAALATCTASTTKSEVGVARRPKPPPRNMVWICTCSGLSPSDLRRGRLVHGLELRAGPDLAAVGAGFDGAVERLHRRVREVGHLVLGLAPAPRPRERRAGVARRRRPRARRRASARYSSRIASVSSAGAGARVPLDRQRVAPASWRPRSGRRRPRRPVGPGPPSRTPGTALRLVGVEGLRPCRRRPAGARRRAMSRPGELHVEAELRACR